MKPVNYNVGLYPFEREMPLSVFFSDRLLSSNRAIYYILLRRDIRNILASITHSFGKQIFPYLK